MTITDHSFYQPNAEQSVCWHQRREVVTCEGGGKFTVTTPCLKTREEHGLQ